MFKYHKNALRQNDFTFQQMFEFKNIFLSHFYYRFSGDRKSI